MALDALRAFVRVHPILDEYREALNTLGIKPIRYPLKDDLLKRQHTGFAKLDHVMPKEGTIAISHREPFPREVLLHEVAHVLLTHLLGDTREHEMEAALVAHQVARRLGWDREASSAARYAKRYATSLRSSDSQDEKEGHDTVVSAYAPDGATQERIRATVEKIVSAFMQTNR